MGDTSNGLGCFFNVIRCAITFAVYCTLANGCEKIFNGGCFASRSPHARIERDVKKALKKACKEKLGKSYDSCDVYIQNSGYKRWMVDVKVKHRNLNQEYEYFKVIATEDFNGRITYEEVKSPPEHSIYVGPPPGLYRGYYQ